jgi:hypothetical protein
MVSRAKTAARDIAYLTRALKARTLRESAGRLAERARTESWTHEEYLAASLQREVAARDAHGGEGRILAQIPARKSIEEFDFDDARGLKHDQVMHLATLDFIDGNENVIFLGPSVSWQCRIQGAAAFRHGRPIDACPLRPGSCVLRLRVAGWLAGRRKGCQCCQWRGSERFSVVEANHRDCDGRPPRPREGCPIPRGRSDPTREDRVGIGARQRSWRVALRPPTRRRRRLDAR